MYDNNFRETPTIDWEREWAYQVCYPQIATITDEHFRKYGRDHAPHSYDKWVDRCVKKMLGELDVQIVRMLFADKPTRRIDIQLALGIPKYIYHARLEAIVSRLNTMTD